MSRPARFQPKTAAADFFITLLESDALQARDRATSGTSVRGWSWRACTCSPTRRGTSTSAASPEQAASSSLRPSFSPVATARSRAPCARCASTSSGRASICDRVFTLRKTSSGFAIASSTYCATTISALTRRSSTSRRRDRPSAASEEHFYQNAWFFHLRGVLPELLREDVDSDLHVIAACGRNRKEASRLSRRLSRVRCA